MDLNEQLADLEDQMAAREHALVACQVELAGLRAQHETLARLIAERSPSAHAVPDVAAGSLRGLRRTDAIRQVLSVASGSLAVNDIARALVDGGQAETPYQVVASTLAMLVSAGDVARVSRGRYAIGVSREA